ncbi:MAG: glycosyltransferase family 39 protein [Candidatus Parvarchaeota archaeon]|nr:glycosyltransferase family 39 protein [Candidatus Haiyanarchaeum thermophilum]
MVFPIPHWNARSKYYWATGIPILIVTILNLSLLHPTFSDDIFYFNVAKQILRGNFPYLHFFFAHPPLHEFLLAFLITIYPTPILVGKLLATFSSSISALLLFLIGLRIYGKKEAFLATIFFLLSPAFLTFSSIGYGIWEMLLFLMLSLWFFLEEKILLASFLFILAFLTRYLALLYFPVYFFFNRKKFKDFLYCSLLLIFSSLFLFTLIFGENFLRDTILFHFTKIDFPTLPIEYFKMQLHLPLLLSSLILVKKKRKRHYVLPMIMDAFLLFSLRHPLYHYFIPSIPIYCLMLAELAGGKWKNAAFVFIATWMVIAFNLESLDFYLNPKHSLVLQKVTEVVGSITGEDDEIFGEPIITNFISLTLNRKIYKMWLDSFPIHLSYERDVLLTQLAQDKPKVFIDTEIEAFLYSSQLPELAQFLQNYELEEEISNLMKIKIYMLR